MRLSDAFNHWCSVATRRPSTRRRYAASIARMERAGLDVVDEITRDRVVEIQTTLLDRGLAAVTVRTELAAVRSVLWQLAIHGRFSPVVVTEMRAAAVKLPRAGRRRRVRHLTRPEFDVLAATAARVEPRIELPIRVAALAGPRVGELARLRADDYRDGTLWIRNMPEWGEAGSCKTGERPVSVCSELARLLKDRLPRSGWLFPSGGLGGREPRTPFVSRWTLETGLQRVRRLAGLPDDITFLVLRHTRASWWLQGDGERSASIYKVADWLGHSVVTCEKSYGSLRDAYDPECERMPAA